MTGRTHAQDPLILVIDDHEDSRTMYAEHLRFVRYRVETAQDGKQGVIKARALKPAVIVMDLVLPGMDGCEATEVLKSLAETKNIWVIAITGHAATYDHHRARAAGVDAFALKPLLPNVLAELVATGLRERRE
jgi:CheY-like chemotaxis protein